MRIAPGLGAQADGDRSSSARLVAHRQVVVDQVDQRGTGRGPLHRCISWGSLVPRERQPQRETGAARRRHVPASSAPPISGSPVSRDRLRPRPSPPSRVLKKGSKTRGRGLRRQPGAVVADGEQAAAGLDADGQLQARSPAGTSSSACSAFISRLWTICSSATGSASTADRRRRRVVDGRRHGTPGHLGRQQVQRAAQHILQRHGPRRPAGRGARSPAAAGPPRRRPGAPVRPPASSPSARSPVRAAPRPAAAGRPGCAGQHRGQRLVQFVGHPGRQLAEGVEPRDLPQPQQFLGAAPRDALARAARRRRPARRPWRATMRPSRSRAVRSRGPAVRPPARRPGCPRRAPCGSRNRQPPSATRGARLDHEAPLPAYSSVTRTGLVFGSIGQSRQGTARGEVDGQRIADRQGADHEPTAPLAKSSATNSGRCNSARSGPRRGQRRVRPCPAGLAPLDIEDRRVDRRAGDARAGRARRRLSSASVASTASYCTTLLAHEPVGDAAIDLEILAQPPSSPRASQTAPAPETSSQPRATSPFAYATIASWRGIVPGPAGPGPVLRRLRT